MELQVSVIQELTNEFISLLMSELCNSSGVPRDEQIEKVTTFSSKTIDPRKGTNARRAIECISRYTPEQITSMLEVLCQMFMQYHHFDYTPKLFFNLVDVVNSLIGVFVSDQGEQVMHSEELTSAAALTSLEKVQVKAFEFLSKFLDEVVKPPAIDLSDIATETIDIIFLYMRPSFPGKVRDSAARILGSLSTSPTLFRLIIQRFWSMFDQCKKELEFRNFTSLIDSVVHLSFQLSEEHAEDTIAFLKGFLQRSKKIERGVLRMKFLDAVIACFRKISSHEIKAKEPEYCQIREDIWSLVNKWSSKSKHSAFCYMFMKNLIIISPSDFYIRHGNQLMDSIVKASKSGELVMLTQLADYIKAIPADFIKETASEFSRQVKLTLIPLLISGNEKKRALKFQEDITERILTEISLKDPTVTSVFFESVLRVENPTVDHKVVRKMCCSILSQLAVAVPEQLSELNQIISPTIEPILRGNVYCPGELEDLIATFPIISPTNKVHASNISLKILEYTQSDNITFSSAASLAVTRIIETLAKPTFCFSLTTSIMRHYIELVDNNDPYGLNGLSGVVSSFLVCLQKNTSELDKIGGSECDLSDDAWISFREKLDCSMALLLLNTKADHSTVTGILDAFSNDLVKQIDTSRPNPYNSLSVWFSSIDQQNLIPALKRLHEFSESMNDQIRAAAYGKVKMDMLMVKYVLILSHKEDQYFNECVKYVFELLRRPNYKEVIALLDYIDSDLLASIIPKFQQWMQSSKLTLQNFWTQSVLFYCRTEPLCDFAKTPAIIEYFENFFSIFWRTTTFLEDSDYYETLAISMDTIVHFAECSVNKLTNVIQNTPDDFSAFIEFLTRIFNFNDTKNIPEGFPVRCVRFFSASLSNMEFQNPDTILSFAVWFRMFINAFNLDSVKETIISFLDNLLQTNPSLLETYVDLSYQDEESTSFVFLEPLARHYETNFEATLAATVVHMSVSSAECKTSACHLIYELCKAKTLFKKPLSHALVDHLCSADPQVMATTSKAYIMAIERSISNKQLYHVFNKIVTNFDSIKGTKDILLNNIAEIAASLGKYKKTKQVLRVFFDLALKSPNKYYLFMKNFLVSAMEKKADSVIPAIVTYGGRANSIPSLRIAVDAITICFSIQPKQCFDTILPLLQLESIKEEVTETIESVKIAKNSKKIPIFAFNAMAQFIGHLTSIETFEEIVVPQLHILLVAALLGFKKQTSVKSGYDPLLSELLDASLYRLNRGNQIKIENAGSMQFEKFIFKLEEVYTGIIERIIPVLEYASWTPSMFWRRADVFVLLGVVASHMSKRTFARLLMNYIATSQDEDDEALTFVLDLIEKRLFDSFNVDEAILTIAVFLRLGQSMVHRIRSKIIRLVGSISTRISECDSQESISESLYAQFEPHGLLFVTSLFHNILLQSHTVTDRNFKETVESLYNLSKIFDVTRHNANHCMILAHLADFLCGRFDRSLKKSITDIDEESYRSLEDFVGYLLDKFQETDAADYSVGTLLLFVCNSQLQDESLDAVVIQLIREIVNIKELHLEDERLEAFMKLSTLVGMGAGEQGISAAGSILDGLIKSSTKVILSSIRPTSIKPTFETVTVKQKHRPKKQCVVVKRSLLLEQSHIFEPPAFTDVDLVGDSWNLVLNSPLIK